eukprot:1228296-Amphidinium_carterae.1
MRDVVLLCRPVLLGKFFANRGRNERCSPTLQTGAVREVIANRGQNERCVFTFQTNAVREVVANRGQNERMRSTSPPNAWNLSGLPTRSYLVGGSQRTGLDKRRSL